MKKPLVFLFILVLCLSVIGVASADKLKVWRAAYTYDVPAGTLSSPDFIPYSFSFSWTYPDPGGSYQGGGGAITVDETADLYPGYVVFRGDFGVWAKPKGDDGRECVKLDDPVTIHPDQPIRFHIGWVPGFEEPIPMTSTDAKLYFQSMTVTVDMGDGPLEMVGHEVTPVSNGNYWENNICSFTVRN